MTGAESAHWLPFGAERASVRLLCLPHAGAGAASYHAWGAGLAPDIAACPVQLPGRESRVLEQPYRRMDDLLTELPGAIGHMLDAPYAVFGHSMGALVAFELVRRIRGSGWPPPLHLFVAGCHAPHLSCAGPTLHDLPACELAEALRALGGTPRQVLDDPALLQAIAPLLRADFSMHETYQYVAGPPLDVPITAFAATADWRASRDQLAAWSRHTSKGFQLYLLPGGHFAVLEHAPFVHARIVEALREHVSQR